MAALDTTGPLNPLGHAFVFADPVERAAVDSRDLAGPDAVRALAAALKAAQDGAFGAFGALTPLIASDPRRSVWTRAALLYGFAAPAPAIRALLDAARPALFAARRLTVQGACLRLLAASGLVAFFDDILHLLAVFDDPEDEFEISLVLDRLLLPLDAPSTLRMLAAADAAAGFDPETRRDRLLAAVATRMAEARAAADGLPAAAVQAGRPLDLHAIGVGLLEHLPRPRDLPRIYLDRLLLEAATGSDLSGFYRNLVLQPAAAVARLEALFDTTDLAEFKPGRRHFFGRPLPD